MKSLSELAELQHDFLRAFMGEADLSAMVSHVQQSAGFNAEHRLSVYMDSITAGLARALQEAYPVCVALVGDEFFAGMTYHFVTRFQSSSPNLYDYGEAFPAFVTTFPPATGLPYLSDICRLEWACHRAYLAADPFPFDANALAQCSEAEQATLTFTLSPSAALIVSEFPIDAIWRMSQADADPQPAVNVDSGGVQLLVYREDYEVIIKPLNSLQWCFLQAIAAGKTLGEIFAEITNENNAAEVIALLPYFLKKRVMTLPMRANSPSLSQRGC